MNTLTLPMPEAVLFDFDGILVDSEPMHYRAFTEVLDPLGMGFPWKEYVEIYMGFDDRDAFREAFRAKGIDLDDATLATLVAAKSGAFLRGLRDGVTAYPGAVPMVESLHETRGAGSDEASGEPDEGDVEAEEADREG